MWFLIFLLYGVHGEYVQNFEIKENYPPGTEVGVVGSGSRLPSPPYLIVPLNGSPENDLWINQRTGEIRTKVKLDRELTSKYSLSAIPRNGETISVNIQVLDANDNAPVFPKDFILMDIPENIPLGTRRPLVPAVDKDLHLFSTRKYEFVSGNERQDFSLQSEEDPDGLLRVDLVVEGNIDRESVQTYELVIRAYDGGNPPKTGTMTVKVRVQDLNDNPPLFDKQRYFTNVPEDLPLGSSVLRVEAKDADANKNGKIAYSINRRQSDKDRTFAIDENTGLILLDRRLNFERKRVHEIVVVAKDGGEVPQETSAFITVRVSGDNKFVGETNLQKPLLLKKFDLFLILLQYLKILQLDLDLLNSGIFLTNTKVLDYEDKNIYSVKIKATDPLYPEQSIEKSIEILVKDANDHRPIFEIQEYYASLEESVEPGSSVLKVKARSKYSDWFKISESTGLITTQTFLDCEMESSPSVVIVAMDHGYPSPFSATATLTVSVSDVNDNQPLFDSSYYEASLPENQGPGECFLRVKATDLDCGANSIVKYSFKDDGDDDKNESFMIEPDSGKICLSKELDHETRDSYDFTIIAKDRGGLSTSTMVKVQVMDVNDNAPRFGPSEYFAKINRKFPEVDKSILQIHAQDDDSNESTSIEYSIISGNIENTFVLDKNLGVLKLAKNIPSNLNRFKLEVEATDNMGLRASQSGGGIATIEILVTDDSEDLSIKQMVYEFFTPRRYFTLFRNRNNLCDEYKSALFSLDSKTGLLRTESRLDHESNPEVVLNIKIEKEGRYNFCQILIHIEDVNDNTPEFGSEIALATVPEDFKVGSIVYVARARDADEGINGEISYRLLNDEDESNFSLNLKSGELKLIEPLDYENRGTHEVLIEAIDNGNPPLIGHLNLKISVHDVNDNNPEFYDTLQELQISENHPNDYVTILPNSGVLILKKPLDREANNEFDVVVSAKDHGTPSLSSELNFKLIVSDKNDNSPKFDNDFYEFSVLENLPSEAIIGTVSAYDHDDGPNGFILYHLKTPIDKFKINENTGLIVTSATDGGTPTRSSQTLVQINVTDVNDNSPSLIEPYGGIFYVKEGSLAGTKIGKLFAKDPDEGDNLIFTTEDTSLVQVSPNGDVRLIRGLDYTEEEYDITIKISDTGSPPRYLETDITIMVVNENDERQYGQKSLTQKIKGARFIMEDMSPVITVDLKSGDIITIGNLDADEKSDYEYEIKIEEDDDLSVNLQIHVKNINDERPIFEQNPIVLEISENIAIGTVLTTVLARDRDLNEQINYELIEESPKRDAFNLDNSSGELTLLQELDYEQDKEFLVVVRAVDTGSRHTTELTIWVTIIDINDNYPIFLSSSNLQIYSDVPLSIPVMRLLAIDYDSGRFGDIAYSIISGNAAEIYDIDENLGDLKLKKVPKSTTYTLTIRARDGGGLHTDTTLTIDVKINNDSTPRFLRSITEVIVPEDTDPNTTILSLDLKQRSSSSESVLFSLIKGTSAFYIDEYSGRINTLVQLDRETQDTYALVVQVASVDTSIFSDTTVINVKISDVNDNPPVFGQSCRDLSFPENINSSSLNFIQAIIAHDKDEGENGQLTYTLENDYDGKFSINSMTGRLFAKSISLRVLDANDNPPVFSRSVYYVRVKEDSPIGTEVIKIFANDIDEDQNSQVRYSLSPSGDKGMENILFGTAQVKIYILDTNDNVPEFSIFPFRVNISTSPPIGSPLLKVLAFDPDLGSNGDVFFTLTNESSGIFELSPKEGILTIANDKDWTSGSIHNLDVIASDKGVPPKTSKGLIEIIELHENPSSGRDVTQVQAVRSDGRKQRVIYTFHRGNKDEAFEINANNGLIRVRDPEKIDFEINKEFNLTVIGQGLGDERLNAYAVVVVQVKNMNDNAPKFPQKLYLAKVLEGHDKGAEVLKLEAIDSDDARTVLKYEIIDGNVDGAFMISPQTSGIIHDGSPSLSGTCRVTIFVIDVNDNHPHFPPMRPIVISKATPPGSLVSNIRANDIDMYPMLTYKLDVGSEYFSINSFNGQLYLLTTPDFIKHAGKVELIGTSSECDGVVFKIDEDSDQNTFSVGSNGEILVHHGNWKKSSLIVRALSDSKSVIIASTVVILHQKLTGNNELASSLVFEGLPSELELLRTSSTEPLYQVKINKPPVGLYFELFPVDSGYKIDSVNGNIYLVNTNVASREKVRIAVRPIGEVSPFVEETLLMKFTDEQLIEEDGFFTTNETSQNGGTPYVRIISGNEHNIFTLVEESLSLILNKKLDYEYLDVHNVIIRMGSTKLSLCHVQVLVINVNDNAPEFPISNFVARLAENSPKGSSVLNPYVIDKDKNDSLTFWTDSKEFKVVSDSGKIFSNQKFDYELKDSYTFNYYVNDSVGHFSESKIYILIESVDEYPPIFADNAYFFSMSGLSNPGDVIGQVKATDQDSGPDGKIFYYFSTKNDYFGIDESRGVITVIKALDTDVFKGTRREKRSPRELKLMLKANKSLLPIAVVSSESSLSAWIQDNLDMELSQTSGSAGVISRFPPQYSEIVLDYDHTSGSGKPSNPTMNPTRSEISEKSHRSASSGRGSVEEGDDEDVEIRMINEGSYLSPDGSLFLIDDDKLSQSSVQNSKDYFARLGIDIRKPPNLPQSQGAPSSVNPSGDNIHNFDRNSIYNRIPEDAISDKNSVVSGATKQSLIYGSNPRTGQPSLTGSLSSIVHSEEELAGSYNWDYLLDWGPQYQPLAHVFKEISRLKDSSGVSRVNEPPSGASNPIINKTFSPLQNTRLMLSRSARSPISHDTLSQSALSPNFHPALSPLATKSPSVSPLALPMSRRPPPPPSSNNVSESKSLNSDFSNIFDDSGVHLANHARAVVHIDGKRQASVPLRWPCSSGSARQSHR
ncbi:DCHS1_2 [Lepeophtheirus salmonis]|uniref:DCHS1_2 n=1 Tax=Lepeophtheirus salmonis TaxID=72036 RepID=A0A7R8D104_LEPSM|nr:DCHS1_2 [Lepeophtheirus salmonis]CAF2989286.1 DCHS1_2 [Lepeophtheirus salmonis]